MAAMAQTLFKAAYMGDTNALRHCLAHGADVDYYAPGVSCN